MAVADGLFGLYGSERLDELFISTRFRMHIGLSERTSSVQSISHSVLSVLPCHSQELGQLGVGLLFHWSNLRERYWPGRVYIYYRERERERERGRARP